MSESCYCVADIVREISRIVGEEKRNSPEDNGEFFFRGEQCNHATHDNSDLDTAFDCYLDRNPDYVQSERFLYEEAMRCNIASFAEDRTMTERVARMQHYGLPTRFADISTNALLAAHFASGGSTSSPETGKNLDGFIRVIKVARDRMKSYTSDTIIAISHLSLVDADRIWPSNEDGLGELVWEIKKSQGFFYSESEDPSSGLALRQDIQKIWAFKPILNSERIKNQGGAFLVFGCRDGKQPLHPTFSPADFDNPEAPSCGIKQIGTVRIDAQSKPAILEELRMFGITAEMVYPDLSDVCKELARRIERK